MLYRYEISNIIYIRSIILLEGLQFSIDQTSGFSVTFSVLRSIHINLLNLNMIITRIERIEHRDGVEFLLGSI